MGILPVPVIYVPDHRGKCCTSSNSGHPDAEDLHFHREQENEEKKQNPRLMEEVGDLILMNKGNFINREKQLNSQV